MSSDEYYEIYGARFPHVSGERLEFISHLANDTWVDHASGGKRAFKAQQNQWRSHAIEFVTTCPDPRELFVFVEMYNWDKGYDLLKAVAVNPACDVSTALAMFWAADPAHYQAHASRDEVPEYNRDGWDLIMGLLARLDAGVYGAPASPFDPADWDADHANKPDSKWQIPLELCRPILL